MKTEVSEEMKKSGFTYREPDKNHPKYKLAEQICKNEIVIDLRYKEANGSSPTSRTT